MGTTNVYIQETKIPNTWLMKMIVFSISNSLFSSSISKPFIAISVRPTHFFITLDLTVHFFLSFLLVQSISYLKKFLHSISWPIIVAPYSTKAISWAICLFSVQNLMYQTKSLSIKSIRSCIVPLSNWFFIVLKSLKFRLLQIASLISHGFMCVHDISHVLKFLCMFWFCYESL